MIRGGIGMNYWDKNPAVLTCLKSAIEAIEQDVKHV